jgi:RNA polymerase sigma factor (sigma-70 family)
MMELLERFAAGDLEAFEELFRLHQKQVYAWIVRIVRDSGIAEDLTVETFWRIYRSRARFDPGSSFGAWAYRIATNAALDHLRRARRETELPEDLVKPGPIRRSGTKNGVGFAMRFAGCLRSIAWWRCSHWSKKSRTKKSLLQQGCPLRW